MYTRLRIEKNEAVEIILRKIESIRGKYKELGKIEISLLKKELEFDLNHQVEVRVDVRDYLARLTDSTTAKLINGEGGKFLNERNLAKALFEEIFGLRRAYATLDTLLRIGGGLGFINTIAIIITIIKALI